METTLSFEKQGDVYVNCYVYESKAMDGSGMARNIRVRTCAPNVVVRSKDFLLRFSL